jgi:hypothetical protein
MQSDFGPRIRPEEITEETRKHLIHESYTRELFGLASVFVPTVCIALMVSLGYRWHGEPPFTEWQPISPILLTAAAILIGIHIWFRRDRRFLKRAPATAAEVKEMETSYDLTHTHRLIIRYKPLPKDPKGATLNGAENSQIVTVAIESNLSGFNSDLHEGDAIAVLYDPAHPDHVRVVEEERSEK